MTDPRSSTVASIPREATGVLFLTSGHHATTATNHPDAHQAEHGQTGPSSRRQRHREEARVDVVRRVEAGRVDR